MTALPSVRPSGACVTVSASGSPALASRLTEKLPRYSWPNNQSLAIPIGVSTKGNDIVEIGLCCGGPISGVDGFFCHILDHTQFLRLIIHNLQNKYRGVVPRPEIQIITCDRSVDLDEMRNLVPVTGAYSYAAMSVVLQDLCDEIADRADRMRAPTLAFYAGRGHDETEMPVQKLIIIVEIYSLDFRYGKDDDDFRAKREVTERLLPRIAGAGWHLGIYPLFVSIRYPQGSLGHWDLRGRIFHQTKLPKRDFPLYRGASFPTSDTLLVDNYVEDHSYEMCTPLLL